MKRHDLPVLDAAIAGLRRTTGLMARVLAQNPLTPAGRADAVLEIKAGGHAYRFVAEVKVVDRFETPGQVKRQWAGPDAVPILVAPCLTRDAAQRCRELRLAFIDTAGNTYLEGPGLLIWVVGQPHPIELKRQRFRALNPAGLQVTFALLCRLDLIQSTYREIARAANVALGTVGPAIKDLEARGFIRWARSGARRVVDPRRLLEEWVTYYHTNLRPKLNPRRFDADTDSLEKADLKAYDAYWGGEVAADKLTHMLKPATFTIYAREPITRLVLGQRLRARAGGRIEVLDAFWNFAADPGHPDVGPPVLAYADLLATQDGRNIEAAKLIYDQLVEPAFHRAGQAG
jgi:hypothetical protein